MSLESETAKLSLKRIKSIIGVELMQRSLAKQPYLIMYNRTNPMKKIVNDRRLSRKTIKFYLQGKLGLNTNGLKNPAHYAYFQEYSKFRDSLKRIGKSYMVKVGNVYSSLKNCNTDLLNFNTVYPVLFQILTRNKYGFVRLLTYNPQPPALSGSEEAATEASASTPVVSS